MTASDTKLHPFFKASRPAPPDTPSDLSDTSQSGSRKKRKTLANEEPASTSRKRQGTLISLVKPREPDPILPTSEIGVDYDDEADADGEIDEEYMHLVSSTPAYNRIAGSSPPVDAMFSARICSSVEPPACIPTSILGTENITKPQKVLKFNLKTGTLGSPPKPKAKALPEPGQPVAKRGRPKKKLIVTLRYGTTSDEERKRIAGLVSDILDKPPNPIDRTPIVIAPPKLPVPPVTLTEKKQSSTAEKKSTHPFFKKAPTTAPTKPEPTVPATIPAPVAPKRNTVSLSTPGYSPQKRAASRQNAGLQGGLAFSNRNSGLKVPGAAHPLFPPKDMVHVRGLDVNDVVSLPTQGDFPYLPRKSKQQPVVIPPTESILSGLQKELNVDGVLKSMKFAADDFAPVPRDLKVPERWVESGRKVQMRIRGQLRTALPSVAQATSDSDSSSDELAVASKISRKVKPRPHAFVARLWDELPFVLSAYDRCTCETSAWTTKYAPMKASEVLQSGREALLLKDWLMALKVDAIHTGQAPKKATKTKKRPKKKGRLDGFIAEDDDEELAYETEDENAQEWLADRDGSRRSVMRGMDIDGGKIGNAVVISGARGVGKTATVYAVARELGYEVFEINATTRRAGKDVLERVGDMTKNHLVKRTDGKKAPSAGGLAGFFGKKVVKEEKIEKPKEEKEPAAQKQSLILIEEADILYEEDKAFWATLITLMATAKRPFVITCNDETLLPLSTLPLQAIFRLRAPPIPETLDSLLLITASEGHILPRDAVSSVLAERGGDIRGALTQLQFWCQMGVGDQKGGFGWVLARWPKGCDLDENGDTVRVVSEGGVYNGIGLSCEGETVTREFGIDIWGWHGHEEVAFVDGVKDRRERLAALEEFDTATEMISAADILSLSALGGRYSTCIDATHPEYPIKKREDNPLGATFLDAEPTIRHHDMSLSLSTYMKELSIRTVMNIPATTSTSQLLHTRLSTSFTNPPPPTLTRPLFSLAFDSIAASVITWANAIDPSVFDRPLSLITTEVAPYVRSIVYHDSNRSEPSEAESDTRRNRARKRDRRKDWFFGCEIDKWAVYETAGKGWVEGAFHLWKGQYDSWLVEERQRLLKEEEERRVLELQRREEERKIMMQMREVQEQQALQQRQQQQAFEVQMHLQMQHNLQMQQQQQQQQQFVPQHFQQQQQHAYQIHDFPQMQLSNLPQQGQQSPQHMPPQFLVAPPPYYNPAVPPAVFTSSQNQAGYPAMATMTMPMSMPNGDGLVVDPSLFEVDADMEG